MLYLSLAAGVVLVFARANFGGFSSSLSYLRHLKMERRETGCPSFGILKIMLQGIMPTFERRRLIGCMNEVIRSKPQMTINTRVRLYLAPEALEDHYTNLPEYMQTKLEVTDPEHFEML